MFAKDTTAEVLYIPYSVDRRIREKQFVQMETKQ